MHSIFVIVLRVFLIIFQFDVFRFNMNDLKFEIMINTKNLNHLCYRSFQMHKYICYIILLLHSNIVELHCEEII